MDTETDSSKWERIRELERMLAQCQETLADAVSAGVVYKENAEEGARRTESAERRVYELEKNKELFQQQRDEAIRERDRARMLADAVANGHDLPIEIEKLRPEPGELFILRIKQDADDSELQAFGRVLNWLKGRYRENAFIAFAKRVDCDLETMPETKLRAMGLILACRVDAGIQQLEAAFGTQQAALRKAVATLTTSINAAEGASGANFPDEWKFVENLEQLLKVELKPEERPTRDELIQLLRDCRERLVWNTSGDNTMTAEGKALEARLTLATGDPDNSDGWIDEELEGS